MVAGHSKKRKTKVAILKIILYLTGSQWSDFSSGLTCSCLLLFKKKKKKKKKKSIYKNRCVVLRFLQPVHVNTIDVNEQRVAAVQATENKSWQSVPSYSLPTGNVCGLIRSNVIRQSYFSLSAHNCFMFWNFMISHPMLRPILKLWGHNHLQLCAFDATKLPCPSLCRTQQQPSRTVGVGKIIFWSFC